MAELLAELVVALNRRQDGEVAVVAAVAVVVEAELHLPCRQFHQLFHEAQK